MTRVYALKRLLEHGRMSNEEIVACTGWPRDVAQGAIGWGVRSGSIRRRLVYEAGRRRWYEYEAVK